VHGGGAQLIADFRLGLEKTIEITSFKDLVLEILLMIPLYGAVLIFIWKLSTPPALLLSTPAFWILSAATLGLLIHNVNRCLRFNLPRIRGNHSGETPYEFQQIAVLSLVYALTFGSELAVVSMFPDFLQTTFGLSVVTAGVLGSSFSFFNLVTRPGGGWLSDRFGHRRTLFLLVIGTAVCFGFMGDITAEWPLAGVLGLAVLCSIFIQAGNGACFAAVPLIRPDLTGKLAGMAGAYGNVGAVFFLVLLSLFGALEFFKWIGAYALFVFITLYFLKPFGTPGGSNPQT
jgi:NNP family nitrate/nitrite transporter-like MFS transporter